MSEFIRNFIDGAHWLVTDDDAMKLPLGIAILIAFAVAAFLKPIREKRRRQAARRMAEKLGLNFQAGPDHDLPERLKFLRRFDIGEKRYAFNIIHGQYRGHPVRAFDYHVTTVTEGATGATRGKTRTSHSMSVYLLEQPVAFPEVEITPKSLFHTIGQAFGMETINFENEVFNKAFVVRAADRRFAHDVCHPRMMEFLLQHPDIDLEIEEHCIAIRYDIPRRKVKEVPRHLDILVEIRELMPRHLYEESGQ